MVSGLPSTTFPNLSRTHFSCWQWNWQITNGSPSIMRTSTTSTSPTKRIVGSSYSSCCLSAEQRPSRRCMISGPQWSDSCPMSCFRNAWVTTGASSLMERRKTFMSKPGSRVRISCIAWLASLPENTLSLYSSTLCTMGWSEVSYFSLRSSTNAWPFWYARVSSTLKPAIWLTKGICPNLSCTALHAFCQVVCGCLTTEMADVPEYPVEACMVGPLYFFVYDRMPCAGLRVSLRSLASVRISACASNLGRLSAFLPVSPC
mmetsp:Transcript_40092/g.119409  ORF Transcript_40092/g.119409 Transcript_40092/m.119409 type:complete len:260 (-) Transcript_40092:348-1127(-)